MQRYPMTTEGAEALRAELQRLKMVDRPRITKAIAEAREHGDLKENAEYHAAREQQGFAEARVRDIESKLSGAQIINIREIAPTGKVMFGTTVTIVNVKTDEAKKYQIVGDDESDIKKGKISVNSPIARGLISKEEGDVVTIDTPGGVLEYEIDQIEHI
ncbi:MAG: transcription elongation factor GreA [Gammaproteobacteria bacterium]|jgi:transcription elongation factor GreA|nr:transcription elongation factor GreA [Gammaproteobacteria bacterium]MBQ0773241.1 transcription elongation factor GreA [Gammaproteobacteria bacterium]|tara:strand:- start:57 stop:533 length:477 start_codon:yes stop_codon:yes gene_type:complete